MPEKLGAEDIKAWIASQSGWRHKNDAIRKEYEFPSFRDSIVFVNRIASIAPDGTIAHVHPGPVFFASD